MALNLYLKKFVSRAKPDLADLDVLSGLEGTFLYSKPFAASLDVAAFLLGFVEPFLFATRGNNIRFLGQEKSEAFFSGRKGRTFEPLASRLQSERSFLLQLYFKAAVPGWTTSPRGPRGIFIYAFEPSTSCCL